MNPWIFIDIYIYEHYEKIWIFWDIKVIKIKTMRQKILGMTGSLTVGGVKDKIASLFKTNPAESVIKPTNVKIMYGGQKNPTNPKTKK